MSSFLSEWMHKDIKDGTSLILWGKKGFWFWFGFWTTLTLGHSNTWKPRYLEATTPFFLVIAFIAPLHNLLLGKLQSWSLYFTTYFNLFLNFLIVSDWYITFWYCVKMIRPLSNWWKMLAWLIFKIKYYFLYYMTFT